MRRTGPPPKHILAPLARAAPSTELTTTSAAVPCDREFCGCIPGVGWLTSLFSPPVRIPLQAAEQSLQHPGKSTLPVVNNKGEKPSQPGEYRIREGEITQRGIGQYFSSNFIIKELQSRSR